MTIKKVIEYVLHTPHNTNYAILYSMLEQLILDYGGNLEGNPESPDEPGKDIIYDGGIES